MVGQPLASSFAVARYLIALEFVTVIMLARGVVESMIVVKVEFHCQSVRAASEIVSCRRALSHATP